MTAVMERAARISPCGLYRYWLSRRWGDDGGALLFVMLNPSTADADLDDPTIRRCVGFARREGADALGVLNLYAFRARDPRKLAGSGYPVGPNCDAWLTVMLTQQAEQGRPVVAAWGSKAQPERVAQVRGLVPGVDWRCLGVTKDGHPRHPLYVRGDAPLAVLP